MLNQDHRVFDYNKTNKAISKNINLDTELDLFLVISSEDWNFSELVLSKILDFAIDNISKENTYKDFSVLLENVNTVLKTWRQDNKTLENDITIFIWILNKNNFLFSNIGKPSAYLIKNTNEVVEITEKEERKKEFNFISDWKLDYWDVIVIASTRLLNYLSYSDFLDSSLGKKTEALNKNIETILEDEKLSENIWITSFKYNFINLNKNDSKLKENLNKVFYMMMDNIAVKKSMALYMIAKEKILKQNKLIKNWLYVTGILLSVAVLFFIIEWIVWTTIETKNDGLNKNKLIEARELILTANNNSSSPEIFDLNIKKAEAIINELRWKQVFLSDIEKLSWDLAIIKKQFNGIETFIESDENMLMQTDETWVIKVLKVNKKLYLITSKVVIWPIIPGTTAKKEAFPELKDDTFIDATPFWESIILITKWWKVVEFAKNWYFSYKDVKNQATWKESNTILSYYQNIYIVPKDENQVIRHTRNWDHFNQWTSYLTAEDSASVGKIIDIAIDGWIYILKENLSLVKFYSAPYRLETITINKLPKNYNIENDSTVKIKARDDLNYVYILLNNKIWVLEPNTRDPYSTQSVSYLGQIEWWKYKIKEFFVDHDWEINVLNENGIYKLSFEVNDGKLIVR